MSEPIYTQSTERMYSRLPEVIREADSIHGYTMKHYLSAIGDVEDQVERLIARFTYLTKQERLTLDALNDDYNYYGLDWRYFQSTDSKNSAVITSKEASAFLRTLDAYRVVPNTTIYAGAVFRTDNADPGNTYGLRLWYYNASMELLDFRNVGGNSGSIGPQWVAINSADQVLEEAYYVRVSPFVKNTSGVSSRVWVDDVYVRSHYEVTTTNNLVSSGHNFVLRSERDLIQQGDFDDAWSLEDLSEWDLGPDVDLVGKSLSGVPEIQAYRYWLTLDSTNLEQPGYLRQVAQRVEANSTYTISMLMIREATVPTSASVRVTITPDTGGPTVKTTAMADYEVNRPSLLTFTWNSPESVSTAIVSIEYITDTMPAQGLLINDVSMVLYNPSVSHLGRIGTPATESTTERAGESILSGPDVRGDAWIRYETGGYPEEPLAPSEEDPSAGASFLETQWHQTRPGNAYTFSGEIITDDPSAYADLVIWYRTDGKGWGETLVSRITTEALNSWVSFTRTIDIPGTATEFRVNLDVHRSSGSWRIDLRNLSLASTTDRNWYTAGSRPFAFNALATRSLNFLSGGDLLHYTANLLATGDPSHGRYGVRIYAGDNQIVHETVVSPGETDELIQITGAFQVPASLLELRAVFYVSDPTPKHQAAYFLSDLEIVHSSQTFVEDPQNVLRNGGFEYDNALEGWSLLAEREQVRRNMVPNPIGPSASSTDSWRTTPSDTLTLVQDEDRPALKIVEDGTSAGLYMDPDRYYTGIPEGATIRFSADVRVTADTNRMRIGIFPYNGAAREGGGTGWVTQTAAEGWVRYMAEAVVTASPDGSHFRMLIWPANGSFATGEGFLVRDVLVEIDTNGKFFDRYSESGALAQYTWDGTRQEHIEHRLAYSPPVSVPMSVSVGQGYNEEDVPDRPDDAPLGTTSDLVDPRTANTEWLPWLSQFAGHNINHFTSLEDARDAFATTESNFAAGTIGAIQSAVGTVLEGTKTVRVFPMTTRLDQIGQATQWDVSIVTRTSESPDISVMEDAVVKRNAKPAGVVFHFHKHQSTWDAVELANPTWDIFDTRDWIGIEEAGLEGS